MNNAEWIDSLRDRRGIDLTIGDCAEIEKMLANGDLRHVDGAFVTALADLADLGRAEYRGATIKRERSDAYRVSFDGDEWVEDSAIATLFAIEERMRRERLTVISSGTLSALRAKGGV
ncbi:hypothetical protein LV82_02580 [Albidovulum inexpectatum]|uniref:Uncharacterized protein n=1 Tax=Albidovulum inexpectatum TaxID=196587 RepID=A0A2S5JEG5_9RHOB|nr:hypothetical protein [Albidovulum inexpectatum]PPB79789.1 hypothetical protein LV82_02580 [Albidovulum inexpectatum]